jgi:hypothetical protein
MHMRAIVPSPHLRTSGLFQDVMFWGDGHLFSKRRPFLDPSLHSFAERRTKP